MCYTQPYPQIGLTLSINHLQAPTKLKNKWKPQAAERVYRHWHNEEVSAFAKEVKWFSKQTVSPIDIVWSKYEQRSNERDFNEPYPV